MSSSSRETVYTSEEAWQMFSGDFGVGEDSLGMTEEEEYDLDSQLGFYSDEAR